MVRDGSQEWENIDPDPSGHGIFFSVHVLFYGVGLGITILLMSLDGHIGDSLDVRAVQSANQQIGYIRNMAPRPQICNRQLYLKADAA